MESECWVQPQLWEKTQWSRPWRLRGGGDWAMAGVTLGSWTGHLQALTFIWTKGVRWPPARLQRGVKTHRAQGRSGQGGPWESGPICGGVDSDPSKALIEAPAAGKCGRDNSHLDGVAKLLTEPPPALRPATAARVPRNPPPLWMAGPRTAAYLAVPLAPPWPT